MLRLTALAAFALLAGCHHAADVPAPATNAAALEATLEAQANAMEADAAAAADRNAADAMAGNADMPTNGTQP